MNIPVIRAERLAYIDKIVQAKTQELDPKGSINIQVIDERNDKSFLWSLSDTVVIGRKADGCDIVISYDKTVSSKQCKIYMHKDKLYVADLEGTNRTYLNDQMLTEATILKDGDILGLGRVNLTFRLLKGEPNK